MRINYYVSRKNVFTWLAAVAALLSLVIRIVCYGGVYEGFWTVLGLFVLPIAASVLFILFILCCGEEQFYLTSISAILFCIYYAVKVGKSGSTLKIQMLYWLACIAVAYIYHHTVSGKQKKWLITIILLGIFAVSCWMNRKVFVDSIVATTVRVAPDLLMLLAGIFILIATDIHLDSKYHPTWGDRKDGRLLRTISPMTTVTAFIMPTRTGASNFIYDSIEINDIEKYILEKRKEGYKGFGITHIFLAAYARMVAKYPAINRFSSGQRVYSRGNDIQFCMVVKSSMSLEAEDSITKIHLSPSDTVFDVYEKLNEGIAKIKNNDVGSSDFDKVEKLLSYTPRLLMRLVIDLLKLLDYFGLLPKFLLEVSPFHGSMFLTSMASLGIPPVVHHLYDFGNLPVFCAIGAKREVIETEMSPLPGIKKKHYIDYTFNTDERICDGFYYAQVFKYMKKLLAHPEVLEQEPEEIKRDID